MQLHQNGSITLTKKEAKMLNEALTLLDHQDAFENWDDDNGDFFSFMNELDETVNA